MKTSKRSLVIIIAASLIGGLALGWLFFGTSTSTEEATAEHIHDPAMETIWTCSMHPQVQLTEPGNCPICGMELIPLTTSSGGMDAMSVSLSPTALALANISTQVVSKDNPVKTILLNGRVKPDERLIYSQSSHIPGRIESLLVNFTGEYVQAGQIIARVYSPELVTAQEELLEAKKIQSAQPALLEAAKQKLRNWKLTDGQIEGILAEESPTSTFPIQSEVSGYVTKKAVNLGDYIKAGQPLYQVTNLSRVWVLFELYENDMPWISLQDEIHFTVPSMPGETFQGRLSYIDPVINPQTRVAYGRLEVDNTAQLLKPEMFASGILEAGLDNTQGTLTIPKSAVLWTGKRSVVYTKMDGETSSFMMREVTLGPTLGERYVIEEGLSEGEEIVVNGAFSIDAAAQLEGKPSMMNPEGGAAMTGHDHGNMNE